MITDRIANWQLAIVPIMALAIALPVAICHGAWTFDVPEATDTISNSAGGFGCAGVGDAPDTSLFLKIVNGGVQRGDGGGSLVGGPGWTGTAARKSPDWGGAGTGTGEVYKGVNKMATNTHIVFVTP